jgi:hypothetical protein
MKIWVHKVTVATDYAPYVYYTISTMRGKHLTKAELEAESRRIYEVAALGLYDTPEFIHSDVTLPYPEWNHG